MKSAEQILRVALEEIRLIGLQSRPGERLTVLKRIEEIMAAALEAVKSIPGLADDAELFEAIAEHMRIAKDFPVEMIAKGVCRHIDAYQRGKK